MADWPAKPILIPLHDPIVKNENTIEEYNGMSGVIYKDARILLQCFSASPESIREFLPPELTPGELGLGVALIAEYPKTTLGPYKEAALMIECQFEDTVGLHVAYMYIDAMYGDYTLAADKALIAGREIMGFPKTLANIELYEEGSRVIGSVRRHGMEIMRIEAEVPDAGDFADLGTMIQVRSVPAPDLQSYLYRDICTTTLEYQPKYTRVGDGSVFFPMSNDLIRNMVVEDTISTFFTIADFSIPMGKILKVLTKP